MMRGSVHFDWDDLNNRVVGLVSQADMIAPLLECLGSLEDVSLVFQNALIQPDCNLVIGEHLSQQCTSLEWWTTRTQLHPTT